MIMSRKRKEYTYEEYKKAMKLLERGYGLTETCRILGWPETKVSTLYYWKHGIIPPVAKWRAEPSKELAYIIGVVQGDGTVCKDERRDQYIVQLATIDSEFVIIFSKAMTKLLNRKYIEPRWNEREKGWRVAYHSKAFVEWYKESEKQGLEGFKKYIEHDTETVRYYLKGLFDSDGNNYRNKRIKLSNINKKLLKYVQYLLERYFSIIAMRPYLDKKAGTTMVINGVKTTAKHDCYRIQIRRKEHIQKFLEEIGFSIVRKQLGLRKHEKVFVEGIGYVQPFKLVELGLFKLPFNDN